MRLLSNMPAKFFDVSISTVNKAVAHIKANPDRQALMEYSISDLQFSADALKAPLLIGRTSITVSRKCRSYVNRYLL